MLDPARADQHAHQATNRSLIRRTGVRLANAPRFAQVLWGVGLAVILGDLVTTVYGLELGFRERNPFVVGVLDRYGVAGLVGLKMFLVGWVGAIWWGLGRRYGAAAMAGLILPQGAAVVLNLLTILGA